MLTCQLSTIVRKYVFYVFLKIQKNATFYVFWSVMSKKNVLSIVQVFTFLHFEIANEHFHCETITHTGP